MNKSDIKIGLKFLRVTFSDGKIYLSFSSITDIIGGLVYFNDSGYFVYETSKNFFKQV